MSGRMLAAAYEGVYELKLVGDVRLTLGATVNDYLDGMFKDPEFKAVLVDLSEADSIDSTCLGVLARLSIRAVERFSFTPTLVSTRPDITRVLVTMGFDDAFNIIETPLERTAQLTELPRLPSAGEDELRDQVIEAHRTLMSMNAHNREVFKDLVVTLETESQPSDPPPPAVSLYASRR